MSRRVRGALSIRDCLVSVVPKIRHENDTLIANVADEKRMQPARRPGVHFGFLSVEPAMVAGISSTRRNTLNVYDLHLPKLAHRSFAAALEHPLHPHQY